jgi:hypothetical protein
MVTLLILFDFAISIDNLYYENYSIGKYQLVMEMTQIH